MKELPCRERKDSGPGRPHTPECTHTHACAPSEGRAPWSCQVCAWISRGAKGEQTLGPHNAICPSSMEGNSRHLPRRASGWLCGGAGRDLSAACFAQVLSHLGAEAPLQGPWPRPQI